MKNQTISTGCYGVCLMRNGEYAKALDVYRNLCIDASGVCLRHDRAPAFHVNYAAVLYLSNNMTGCESVLNELDQDENPGVLQMRSALNRWRGTLS